jgi:hypothetical protein
MFLSLRPLIRFGTASAFLKTIANERGGKEMVEVAFTEKLCL